MLKEKFTEKTIDAVEILCKTIDGISRHAHYLNKYTSDSDATAALNEINCRFLEAGVGYSYTNGEIIRIDSQLIHSEVVKPALLLLNTKEYAGAHQEFLTAYEHYRHKRHKEAMNDCLKAFESTMKAICVKRKWAYNANDTASKLIDVCLKNKLIPEFWQTQMGSLRSLLESSIPTGRNKTSGHGQGPEPTVVPEHLVGYMLHMTASTLVFLANAEKALP